MAVDYLEGCTCVDCTEYRNNQENTKKEEGSNMSEAITEVTEIGNARIAKLNATLIISETGGVSLLLDGKSHAAAVGGQILKTFNSEVGGERLDVIEALVEANRDIYTHYEARRSAEESLSKAFDAHRKDIQLIGDRLNTEANDRDWCAEFDNAITDLNGALSIGLPSREVEKEFLVEGYLRIPFTHYFTATVNPGDSSYDQQAMAQEEWESNYGTRDVQMNERDAEFEDGSIEVSFND